MIEITENLIAELKLYIKEHYKLVSFTGLFLGNKKKQQGIREKGKGIRAKSFGEVSDLMSGFICIYEVF